MDRYYQRIGVPTERRPFRSSHQRFHHKDRNKKNRCPTRRYCILRCRGAAEIPYGSQTSTSSLRKFFCNKYPPAEPEVLRLLAPQKGLTAIVQNLVHIADAHFDDILHEEASPTGLSHGFEIDPPGIVKLRESPGRAGGLPMIDYLTGRR
jgi:hypothetical protein